MCEGREEEGLIVCVCVIRISFFKWGVGASMCLVCATAGAFAYQLYFEELLF
jgi:hypothetical protein